MHNMVISSQLKNSSSSFFKIEDKFNNQPSINCIMTACEKQCVHCNVNSQKLGLVRS